MAYLDKLNPATSALVIIDLQKMVMARETVPRTPGDVLASSVRLAVAFRKAGGLVVCVHVSFSQDRKDALAQSVDRPNPPGQPDPDYDKIAAELQPNADNTIVVKKKNWGAFYGTDLDLQLRRRNIDTIVLTGISTSMGVESTARAAHEHGYQLFLVEDAMAAMAIEEHERAVQFIFPKIGHVVTTDEVLGRLKI